MKSLKMLQNFGAAMLLSATMMFGFVPGISAADSGFSAEALTLQPGGNTGEINLNWYADGNTAADVTGQVKFVGGGATLCAAAEETVASDGKIACKATVSDLVGGKTYVYQVSNDGGHVWSKEYTYTVDVPDRHFRFAFVGDPQLKNGNQDGKSLGMDAAGVAATELSIARGWNDTLSAIADESVNFIASAGDQVDTTMGNNEGEYTMFFAPEQMQSLPFAAAVGNHDRQAEFLYHYNLPNEQDVSETAMTSAAATAVTSAVGNYFYFYDNSLFVVLNDADYPSSKAEAEPYIAAYRSTLEAATAAYPDYQWLFVQHHKSTESVAQHVADTDIQYYVEAGFEKLMDEFQVDFVLAGHDHVYARSHVMYNGERVSDGTDKLTNPAGTVYLTCNTGSGLKYYGIFSQSLYVKDNENYPYLADGMTGSQNYLKGVLPLSTNVYEQSYTPGYTIVDVDDETVTFTSYATYANADGSVDATVKGTPLDTFTVTKTKTRESRTQGVNNENATLKAELAARYDSEVVNADGGSTEIVAYNSDNDCAYAVNGTTGHLVKINVADVAAGKTVDGMTGVHIPVREIMAANDPSFDYGDMTSVAVSTELDVLAVALQNRDYSKNGKLLLLTYDGEYIASYDTGVQPDMVTFTDNGMIALTADEGEPRMGIQGTDPKGSVTMVDFRKGADKGDVTTVTFDDFDRQREALVSAGVVLLKGSAPSVDFEPEYIAVNGDTAYVTLQEANAVAVFDLTAKKFTGVYSLGLQDYSKTAVDLLKNDAIEMTNFDNVYGIKMPDGIDAYTVNGKTYLVTANEGDSRSDWEGLDNEVESKTSPTGNVTLDEKAVWFDATQYDGLNPSKAYVFGGRSFSVYRVDKDGLKLVADSGSDFEAVTAAAFPDYFNCSNDKTALDNRSGKKGPEPENVTVGMVNGKTYAFVALERIGGIMVYDISDPAAISYVNYINSRDFSEKIAGDVAPEGLAFVADKNMLLSANEVSGTVCAYLLTAVEKETTMPFTDVHQNQWFYDDVAFVYEQHLMNGTAASLFSPDNTTTRGMAVTILYRLQGEPAVSGTCPFGDVAAESYYEDAVTWAAANKIVNGYDAENFGPDDLVTREQLVTMLYRYADFSGCDVGVGENKKLSDFKDAAEIDQYALPAFGWAYDTGLVQGDGQYLMPKGNALRAQMAAMMHRFCENL